MVRSATYVAYALLLAVTCLESVAQSAQETSSPTVSLSRSEARLVKAVNAYRRKYGLEPLRVDPSLMRVVRATRHPTLAT